MGVFIAILGPLKQGVAALLNLYTSLVAFLSWAHSKSSSEFIRLAHMGFYEDIGKNAHGLFRIYRLFVAALCDHDMVWTEPSSRISAPGCCMSKRCRDQDEMSTQVTEYVPVGSKLQQTRHK